MSRFNVHGKIDGSFIRLHEYYYDYNEHEYKTDKECAVNPEQISYLEVEKIRSDYGYDFATNIVFNNKCDISVHEEMDEVLQLLNLVKITKRQELSNYE